MNLKFLKCEPCGKIVVQMNERPCPTMCCDEAMKEIIPNTVDAAKEKHVPVFKIDGTKVFVDVGEVLHPMTEEHFIEWILLETKNGNQRHVLKAGDNPHAEFAILPNDEVLAVYAYCNLHGLWKA